MQLRGQIELEAAAKFSAVEVCVVGLGVARGLYIRTSTELSLCYNALSSHGAGLLHRYQGQEVTIGRR